MKKNKQIQPIAPLPLHFKKPGRSYSQIGRKGNVALYQVFSDYLILPDFAQPYLTIGYELIVVKHDWRTGNERYPRTSEFGSSAWSIPKSLSRSCSTRTRMRSSGRNSDGLATSQTVPYRSPIAEEFPALLEAA